MLVQLTIRDLGLIEAAELDFDSGFNVITGETGVGKSMLLGSLSALRGDRVRSDQIRSGQDRARVTGFFSLDETLKARLEDLTGLDLSDGELLVERRLRASGRNQALLNGQEFPLSMVRRVGEHLFEIQGQAHARSSLLDPKLQLDIVDRFGGLSDDVAEFAERYQGARELAVQIDGIRSASQERNDRRLFLTHVVKELEEAELVPGEREALERELELLEERERILSAVERTIERLYDGEDSFLDQLSSAEQDFAGLGDLHEGLREFVASADAARAAVENGVSGLRSVRESLAQGDAGRVHEVRERHETIARLEERYRRQGDALLDYFCEAQSELEQLEGDDEQLPKLEEELREHLAALGSQARSIASRRRRVAKKMAAQVTSELADLGLAGATFEIVAEKLAAGDGWQGFNATGTDTVEFLFGPNPGEPMRKLRETASGGELSRVMLSLKRVLAKHDKVPILIFDEIDAGVGGRLGTQLGRKLQQIAGSHQVICVTHMPQIASFGGRHFHVSKSVDKKRKVGKSERTTTRIDRLVEDRRVEEIAAMIRGETRTETSLAEAREMMSEALE